MTVPTTRYGSINSTNISTSSYITGGKSNYIESINIWLTSDISSIAAIQFGDSEIFGNPNVTNIDRVHTNIKSSEGSNYVFAGYSGSLVSTTIDGSSSSSSSSDDELDVLSSLSFIWRDKTKTEQGNTDGYRVAIFIAGLWWFVLFYFPAKYILKRPGVYTVTE